ncbi:MAG: nitrous oxide-stimulated promoter family protein [Syntrophomonas sp.]|nr:nitrous oxide-stimulated promoter family protein [Syntrophomonas sp.]
MAYSRRLELKTMDKMISLYCRDIHGSRQEQLCPECQKLLDYAGQRLDKCPFGENKPVCAQCTIHCYKPEQRETVKNIMRYSGPRMLWKSPILTARYMYRKKFKKASDIKPKR